MKKLFAMFFTLIFLAQNTVEMTTSVGFALDKIEEKSTTTPLATTEKPQKDFITRYITDDGYRFLPEEDEYEAVGHSSIGDALLDEKHHKYGENQLDHYDIKFLEPRDYTGYVLKETKIEDNLKTYIYTQLKKTRYIEKNSGKELANTDVELEFQKAKEIEGYVLVGGTGSTIEDSYKITPIFHSEDFGFVVFDETDVEEFIESHPGKHRGDFPYEELQTEISYQKVYDQALLSGNIKIVSPKNKVLDYMIAFALGGQPEVPFHNYDDTKITEKHIRTYYYQKLFTTNWVEEDTLKVLKDPITDTTTKPEGSFVRYMFSRTIKDDNGNVTHIFKKVFRASATFTGSTTFTPQCVTGRSAPDLTLTHAEGANATGSTLTGAQQNAEKLAQELVKDYLATDTRKTAGQKQADDTCVQVVFTGSATVTGSQIFIPQCATDETGRPVTYETEKTLTTTGSTLEEAKANAEKLAQQAVDEDIQKNGQSYADLAGICTKKEIPVPPIPELPHTGAEW